MHFRMQIPKRDIKIFIPSFHSVIFIFITSLRAHLPYHSIKKCLQKDYNTSNTMLGTRNSRKNKTRSQCLWSFPGS